MKYLQVLRYGPSRNLWLYRTEAKNNSLKQFRKKNFINAPLSLLLHNQLRCSYEHSSNTFLTQEREAKEGRKLWFCDKHPALKDQFQRITGLHDCEVYSTDEVIIHGLKYRKGACLLLEWPDNWPHFIRMEELFITDQNSIAICTDL